MTAYVPGLNERDLNKLITSLQQLAAGRSNAYGTVTCSTGTTTTITDANCAVASKIKLTPTTANAALAVTNVYVSAKANGSFTLTHGSTTSTDRTFDYAIQG